MTATPAPVAKSAEETLLNNIFLLPDNVLAKTLDDDGFFSKAYGLKLDT